MGFTVAVWDSDGWDNPKIQIWREAEVQPGVYHKIDSDVPISNTNPQLCYQSTFNSTNGSGIFQCTLQEDFHISVQPGEPTSLVFHSQMSLESTVSLFTNPHTISNDEPQITFLVVLGKEFLYLLGEFVS